MSAFGQAVSQKSLDDTFLTGPGETLVRNTFQQMVLVKGKPDAKGKDTFPFQILFGPYTPGKDEQRWADYQRFDWMLRQLPVINAFESAPAQRSSDQGYITGAIQFQAYWPASLRRSELARVQAAFQAVMQNFFSSRYVQDMLDEAYFVQRLNKVPGLNEFGKQITWTPNVEGLIESELVPTTIVDVSYRIDLRSWNRALEFQNRTKAEPFRETLSDLTQVGGEYDGVTDDKGQDVEYVLDDEIKVSSP